MIKVSTCSDVVRAFPHEVKWCGSMWQSDDDGVELELLVKRDKQ